MTAQHVSGSDIRAAFSTAMSAMYRTEVPAYGTLIEIVTRVNAETLAAEHRLTARLEATGSLARISEERHGAIRLGTAHELATMRRAFAVMGMHPVGYYDLSEAGVPVHSTAFRPISEADLKRNPFRVFTSLLRLDLIADAVLRSEAAAALGRRRIFTPGAIRLIETAERNGGLGQLDAERFIVEMLETFRWHDRAVVDLDLYERLHAAHRLAADVVSFRGPHINHLTPRTLDIDRVQAAMPRHGITAKAVVEGPPRRDCPILLRQTSFKALEEYVSFAGENGEWRPACHTARFGEVEQRGAALTPRGRALYDRLLGQARALVVPAADGSNAADYENALTAVFAAFPDDWNHLREAGLAYFVYSPTAKGLDSPPRNVELESAIAAGLIQFDPIVYEDFLPVSAAGIFQSNLGDEAAQGFAPSPNRSTFERDLGTQVLDEFAHYASIEHASIAACLAALAQPSAGGSR